MAAVQSITTFASAVGPADGIIAARAALSHSLTWLGGRAHG